jgi:hypothetical protein
MKKIICALIALYSAFAFSATTVPVQLLNPTGSTSGQAVVSNGPSSSPTWQNVAVANVSGAAPLASPTFTGIVTAANLTATGNITPSQTAGIVGTTTNNNANAGSVGEYQTVTGSSAGITGGTSTNVTSISLTAGDWDVQGVVLYTPTATISIGYSGISTTSATFGSLGTYSSSGGSSVTATQLTPSSPVVRLSLATTTTVFLIGNVSFPSGTCTAQGFIRARRVR